MCKVLKVSRAGYNEWLKSGPSQRWKENEMLQNEIRQIFELSHGTYGSPRITEELKKKGKAVGQNRVAKIMRVCGLKARKPRKFKATTDSKHNYPIAPNLLDQDFNVKRPGEVWVSDIT